MTEAESVHSTPRTDSPIKRLAESVDSFLFRTAIHQRATAKSLGDLARPREEASAEIERLLAFLDCTEPDPDLEPDDFGIADLDGLVEQAGSRDWRQGGMA